MSQDEFYIAMVNVALDPTLPITERTFTMRGLRNGAYIFLEMPDGKVVTIEMLIRALFILQSRLMLSSDGPQGPLSGMDWAILFGGETSPR